jgi:hypothetical protein
MHLLSKINVNLVSSCHSCVHLYMAIHFIITFHILCIYDSHVMHVHFNRCSRGRDAVGVRTRTSGGAAVSSRA